MNYKQLAKKPCEKCGGVKDNNIYNNFVFNLCDKCRKIYMCYGLFKPHNIRKF